MERVAGLAAVRVPGSQVLDPTGRRGRYYLDLSGTDRRYFLLEYDRGTMRRRDYRRKLAGIATFFKSGRARSAYGDNLTVLVVSETDQGERRFVEALVEAEGRWQTEVPALFTTRARISRDPRGLLGLIWRTPAEEQRRNWFEVTGRSPKRPPVLVHERNC